MEKILGKKTDNELIELIKHNKFSSTDAKLEAISELERRDIKIDFKDKIYDNLIDIWENKRDEINTKSRNEEYLIYSPYLIFIFPPILLILFIGNEDYRIDNLFLIAFAAFTIMGVINIFACKRELKIIKEEREKENDKIDEVIDKIMSHNE